MDIDKLIKEIAQEAIKKIQENRAIREKAKPKTLKVVENISNLIELVCRIRFDIQDAYNTYNNCITTYDIDTDVEIFFTQRINLHNNVIKGSNDIINVCDEFYKLSQEMQDKRLFKCSCKLLEILVKHTEYLNEVLADLMGVYESDTDFTSSLHFAFNKTYDLVQDIQNLINEEPTNTPQPEEPQQTTPIAQETRTIDEERFKKYFKSCYKGIGKGHNDINHFANLIGVLQEPHTNSEFARLANMIYSSNIITNKPKTFKSWYNIFCECVGCEQLKEVKPSRLKEIPKYKYLF